MKLTEEIRFYIENSVLCWLATSSADNQPNVSPKEVFTYFGTDTIILANIASPESVKNIKSNPKVSISFIDILVQKGYQIKGRASIITKAEPSFKAMEKVLQQITEGKFPFASITKVLLEEAKTIIAPKYNLYPDTTEEEQVESAKRSYGF